MNTETNKKHQLVASYSKDKFWYHQRVLPKLLDDAYCDILEAENPNAEVYFAIRYAEIHQATGMDPLMSYTDAIQVCFKNEKALFPMYMEEALYCGWQICYIDRKEHDWDYEGELQEVFDFYKYRFKFLVPRQRYYTRTGPEE